jgi:DNA-binding NarL/FixJ family response regulator
MIGEKISILIVDDHPMVLEGMTAILKNISSINQIHKASMALEAIKVLRENVCEVVITDINLPEISGIDLCKKIKKEFPDVKVIAMSTFQDKSYISNMIQNGASGYLSKTSSPEEIEKAIVASLQNQITINVSGAGSTPSIINNDLKTPVITTREKEVLELISQGLTNKEIADKIFVSTHTVDTHRKNLLTKFNVLNTAALITAAGKFGLI